MLGRIVTTLKRLMGFQSIPVLEPAETTPSTSAKSLRAKSGRTSKAVQEQSKPVSKSAKPKRSPARSTKAVASRKPASKPAQTTNGKRGRPRKTPA